MEPIAQAAHTRLPKKRLVQGVVLAAVIAALVFLTLKTGLTDTVNSIILGLREAGPTVFFVAMALLPAVGFPLLAFTLAAGPVFGPTLGAAWVIAWSLSAVVVNLLLTYWLARRAVRPLMIRALKYFEIRLPDSSTSSAWQIILIVRLTPGPPFWVQNYLLGVIRVPLAPYLIVSTLVMAGYIVALVCGGEAITTGNGRLAFAAIAVLVVSVASLQLLSKWITRRRTAAALMLGPREILALK